jgi:hypothetical protein
MVECPVGLPNGQQTAATKEGTVVLSDKLKLANVLYVPSLQCNLISVSQLINESDCVAQFTNKICAIQDRTSRMVIGAGELREGLYYLRGRATVATVQTGNEKSFNLWHKRLGHPSSKVLELVSNIGAGKISSLRNQVCDVYLRAKQIRDKFPASDNKTLESFQLIHCDLWGPYRTTALCGARYFLTIVDDYSRATWIYLLLDKKEVSVNLCNFIALVERQFNKQVKTVRSDNGTEFIYLGNYFHKHGIMHETSCARTPQQNGRVEHKHRHILNVARALRFQANLPIEFGGECILTAGYVINRTPPLILHGKTPYEVLYGMTPQLEHMRVFGCLCYIHNQGHKGDKFASHSRKCVFMGYPYSKKGWRVYDLGLGVFLISRDVVFCEDKFPYLTDGQQSPLSAHVDYTSGPIIDWVSMDGNEGPNTTPHSYIHENLVPHVR